MDRRALEASVRLSTLDRHVLIEIAALRWAVLLFIGTFLLMLGDFIGQMGYNVQVLKNQQFDLLARYYLLRFPEFLLVWLPLSVPGAAILTAIPMMRQRTIIALSASGIPPRRTFASLIALALLAGALGFVLKDQVVPRLQDETDYVHALMDGKVQEGESRSQPAGWRSADTHWSAQAAYAAIAQYHEVCAFRQASRYDDDVTVMAARLLWRDGAWWLDKVIRVAGGRQERIAGCRPEQVGLELTLEPHALALALRSDDAKTIDEVHKSKGNRYKQILSLRVAAAFLPLVCLLFALPFFVRQQSGRVGTATAASLILAVTPLAALGVLGKLMVSASLNPVTLATGLMGVLLIIGAWLWWRMRL